VIVREAAALGDGAVLDVHRHVERHVSTGDVELPVPATHFHVTTLRNRNSNQTI